MYIKKLLFIFSFFIIKSVTAQDSCNFKISLLTCSPGAELYSTFGHSALRVTNTVSGEDVVYNYGTFNFDEPGFYTKFIRGKLLYYLSTTDFPSFAESYRQENRSMTEQVMNLNCKEKKEVMQFLAINILPGNRAYKYDFLFDNCTTRLRDLAEKFAEKPVTVTKIVPPDSRFRELIHIYLDSNQQHWSKLGIDLLLGSRTDAVMSNREAMFLPDYLLMGFDSLNAGTKKLVLEKKVLFQSPIEPAKNNILNLPVFYSSILFLLVFFLGFSKKDSVRNVLKNFDAMLMFIVGLLGSLMLFMWFGTDHVMCSDNYNLLWAWPSHVIVAFFLNRNKSWVSKYLIAMIIVYILVLIMWIFIPQQLNVTVIPILLLIVMRAGIRVNSIKRLSAA